MGEGTGKKLLAGLFLFYLAALTWIIIFKMSFSLKEIQGVRGVNLIPFHCSLIVNGKIDVSEMIQNMLAFCPFGIYAGVLWKKWSAIEKISVFFLVSFIYEMVQYILAVGRTDITDIINNTLGGILGLIIYEIIRKICRTEKRTEKVITICAGIVTILMTGLIVILLAAN